MTDQERAEVSTLLAALELTLCECRLVGPWWSSLSSENQFEWATFSAQLRQYQHALRNPEPPAESVPAGG